VFVVENVPQPAPVQVAPAPAVADQFTPLPSFVVAVSDNVWFVVIPEFLGETVTVIPEAAVMVSESVTDCCWCVGLLESMTWKVSEASLTAAVGVPLITPVEVFRAKPRLASVVPPVCAHVYGLVPPPACSVAL
jgi:hypothetical protein